MAFSRKVDKFLVLGHNLGTDSTKQANFAKKLKISCSSLSLGKFRMRHVGS
jgi:hypothetical protein